MKSDEIFMSEALKEAQKAFDSAIYVTIEPCAMCAGALMFARVKRLAIRSRLRRMCWKTIAAREFASIL